MNTFAVIDTETNWDDEVMSVGMVIADDQSFTPLAHDYFIIKDCHHQGMFTSALPLEKHLLKQEAQHIESKCSFKQSVTALKKRCQEFGTRDIFAYNAGFDHRHLPEMHDLRWYDIIQKAAYTQHNKMISQNHEVWSTGRLKRNYGVESIYRLLSGDRFYCETHNALMDALVELEIMKLLNYKVEDYRCLKACFR